MKKMTNFNQHQNNTDLKNKPETVYGEFPVVSGFWF